MQKGTAANLSMGFKFSLVPWSCSAFSDYREMEKDLGFSQQQWFGCAFDEGEKDYKIIEINFQFELCLCQVL